MNKRTVFPVFVMSVSSIVTNVGHGSWVIGLKERSEILSRPSLPAAKIGSKKYMNVSKAISESKSGDTIEIIVPSSYQQVKSNYEVKSLVDSSNEVTIPNGVTLVIPYEDGVRSNKKADKQNGNHSFDNISTYCKNTLTVADGITLINNGTIEVGGVLSSNGGSTPTGCTAGNFAKLELGENSTLINHGTINLFGLITEKKEGSAKVITKPGSETSDSKEAKINMPMYWYDFSGGTALKAAYDGIETYKCYPMTDFYFENITTKSYFYSGSSLISWANLYAARTYGQCDIPIITSDASGLIQLTNEDAYLLCDYSPRTLVTDLSFYGGCAFNNLVIDLKTATGGLNSLADLPDEITTAKGYFPVSYHYNVWLKQLNESNSVYEATNSNFKFMNGSHLCVDEGVTLNVKGLVCYEGFDYYTDRSYPGKVHSNSENATILNNGQINATDAVGTITTNTTGSIFVADSNTMFKMYEPKSISDSTITWFEQDSQLKMASDADNFCNETGKYTSFNDGGMFYWNREKVAPRQVYVSFVSKDGTYEKTDEAGEYTLIPQFSTDYFSLDKYSYKWAVTGNDAYFVDTKKTTSEQQNPTLYVPAATSSDKTYTVTLTVDFKNDEDKKTTTINNDDATREFKAINSCLLPTASILMADGSYKKAGDIKPGDIVISCNHETGLFEPNIIIANAHRESKEELYDVIHLEFTNGIETDLIKEHGYFDVTTNRYEYFRENSFRRFIGHEFVSVDKNGGIEKTVLKKAYLYKKMTTICSPISAKVLDVVADDMLSITGCLFGLFNIFEYDPRTLAFDKEKKEADIAKYGLLGYETYKSYFPKEIYDALPCEYMAVAVGKGVISWETIREYIAIWKEELMKFIG